MRRPVRSEMSTVAAGPDDGAPAGPGARRRQADRPGKGHSVRIRAGLCVAALVAAGLTVGTPAAATPAAAPVADATVVPIQVTGDPATRFNLVMLGDGYTEADLPTFRSTRGPAPQHPVDDRAVQVLPQLLQRLCRGDRLRRSPGSDCDPGLTAPQKRHPAGHGLLGRLQPGERAAPAHCRQRRREHVRRPGRRHQPRQPADRSRWPTATPTAGPAAAYATASGGNALSALISPHEIGHSLGGLQDEYDYYGRGVPGGTYSRRRAGLGAPHAADRAADARDQQKKWWRWLGEPSEAGGDDRPLRGRHVPPARASGGPSQHSIMKSLGYYYDQVGRERHDRTDLRQGRPRPGRHGHRVSRSAPTGCSGWTPCTR